MLTSLGQGFVLPHTQPVSMYMRDSDDVHVCVTVRSSVLQPGDSSTCVTVYLRRSFVTVIHTHILCRNISLVRYCPLLMRQLSEVQITALLNFKLMLASPGQTTSIPFTILVEAETTEST